MKGSSWDIIHASDVRLGVVVTTTDVGVDAWKPDLFEDSEVTHRFVRHGKATGRTAQGSNGRLTVLDPEASPKRMEKEFSVLVNARA
jgi:hypothetical protein